MKNIYSKSLFLLLFVLLSFGVNGQISVTPNQTAQQLIQKLVGSNVLLLNPTLNCPTGHSGSFDLIGTSNLGLSGGIILATGTATDMANPASYSIGQTTSGTAGDTDLSNLIGEVTTNNACILEFDFIPDIDTTSTLSFKYVFGSEEYPGYTCSDFNDVFGFLITGAPTYNKTNIALVPGTNIPVAINSINSGVPSGGPQNLHYCTNMGTGSPFTQYFIDNLGQNGQTIALDGFTTVLEAKATVEPCSTYHMKLGIANAVDGALQSGVFLLENSFSVDSVMINLADIIKTDSGYVAEGCSEAKMTIIRDTTSDAKKKLCFDYGGTATYGVDYNALPYTVTLPPKQYDTTFPIIPTQDMIPELPYETIIIRRLNCCTQTPVDSVELRIYDSLKITLHNNDTGVCGGQTFLLHASGDGDFNYHWEPANVITNPDDSFTTGYANKTTTFTVTASFMNCPDVTKSFTATVEPTPEVKILNTEENICLGSPLQLKVNVQPDDYTDYKYLWSPPTGISDPYIKEPEFFITEPGTYSMKLTVETATLGCTDADSITFIARPAAHLTDVTSDFTLKYGDAMQLNADGVSYYTWSPTAQLDNPNISTPNVIAQEPTVFMVVGVNEYGCFDTAYVKMDVDYTMHEVIPNAFSPNGDGRNDLLSVKNMKFQQLIEFRIFNRWGQELFSTTDYKQGWDGTYKGVPQETGVYNYIIRIALPNGQQRVYKGDITLLR